jgi:GH24 family phage-related lysozyme (muramidase)
MPDPLPMIESRISEQYPEAAALIRKWESVNQSGQPHLNPYPDYGGKTYVAGFGRTIDNANKDIPWTVEQSEEDLDVQMLEGLKDIDRLEKELPKGMLFTFSEKEALIPFMQNVGYQNLIDTEAVKALRKGDKKRFAFELFDAEQGFTKGTNEEGDEVVLGGLVTRRGEEGSLFFREYNTGGMVQRNPYPYMARPI